jgi:hypothetical protein
MTAKLGHKMNIEEKFSLSNENVERTPPDRTPPDRQLEHILFI